MAASRYHYESLPSRKHVRMASVLAGKADEPLRCQVTPIPLGALQFLSFEAVSYVWGDENDTTAVEIETKDGFRTLNVTRNLVAALRRFRFASSPRILWVDSICIDQGDLDEKNVQVEMTGDVYRQANWVLVWLGEEEDPLRAIQTNAAIRQMDYAWIRRKTGPKDDVTTEHTDVPNIAEINEMFHLSRKRHEYFHDKLAVPRLFSPEFQAILHLFRNPWFTRAWTWQENYVAEKVLFRRGGISWSRNDLMRASAIISELAMLTGLQDEYEPISYNAASMLAYEKFFSKGSKQNEFSSILDRRSGAHCKLPADVIYSLLGAAAVKPDIRVDYRLPYVEVYARATSQIILADGTLSILKGLFSNRSLDPDLPSWTPNWRQRANGRCALEFPPLYAATGASRAVPRSTEDEKILVLQGLNLDTIRSTSPAGRYQVTRDWAVGEFNSSLGLEYIYQPTKDVLRDALHRIEALDNTSFDSTLPLSRWSPESFSRFSCIMGYGKARDEQSRLKHANLMWTVYADKHKCSFFITHGGRLGIANKEIQAEDKVVLLLGGDIAYILRETGNPQHYTMVSNAYVHGYMDGEALIDAKKAADPSWDASDASWLKDANSIRNLLETEEFHIH